MTAAILTTADHCSVTKQWPKFYKPILCAIVVCFSYYAYLATSDTLKTNVINSLVDKIHNISSPNIYHLIQKGFSERTTVQHLRRTYAIPRNFVMSGYEQIFILGATGINSTKGNDWGMFRVLGQREKTEKESSFLCCLKYPDGSVTQLPVMEEEVFFTTGRVPVPIFNVVCSNSRYNHTNSNLKVPSGVSVIYEGDNCLSSGVNFIVPHFPLRQANNSMAVTTKISHGSVSPDLLIAWMEAYLWLGADKVITYALDNVTADYRRVLEYYAARNVLDLYDYQIPALEEHPRSLGARQFQTFTDAALPMLDALARSSGYTYFSVVDWDEFIIPSHNRTLKQLMNDLLAVNSKASVVRFKTQYHLTSAEPEDSDIYLKRFTQRLDEEPEFDRVKSILEIEHAHLKTTHIIAPQPGFILLNCPTDEAFIRHYRFCILDPRDYHKCPVASDLHLVNETDVAEWSDNIAENIRRAKSEIFS